VSLPLQGITVLAFEQAVAVPFATRQLADLGARVIKLERPRAGDFARAYDRTVLGQSSHFVWLNRSKESLSLDLKHAAALPLVHRLLERCDVFVQNLAPGATDRLGLAAAALRARYPRLVVCDLSGYGRDGPYADRKAYDLLVQCEAGLLSVTGTAETPSKAGISAADIAAGMYAYSGILTALFQRERSGEGAHLEVTMLEALGEWMGYPAYYAAYGGSAPPRTGAAHATIYPYGPFTANDGRSVFFGIQNEREWASFCKLVLQQEALAGDSRFTPNPQRHKNREALGEILLACFAGIDSAELVRRLDAADIANARLNSPQEFWQHPQLAARNRKRQIDTPAGAVEALLPPVNMSGVEPRMAAMPSPGQHTADILTELGYSAEELAQLRAAGAV
jgi:itaconate CoA-transferase